MKITQVALHTEKEWGGFHLHFHTEEWQIEYFRKGEGRYFLEDCWFKIRKNFFFIIPPGNRHQLKRNTETKLENISIKFIPENNKEFFLFSLKKPLRIKIKEKEKITRISKNIVAWYILLKEKKAKENLYSLIEEIDKILKKLKILSEEKIDLVKEIIEENYFLDSLTLSYLAKKIDLNPQYLCRKYKKITGKSPIEYLREIRMRESYKWVIESEEPLKKIARQCGFKNVYYFTTSFKKYFNITPGKLRKNRR